MSFAPVPVYPCINTIRAQVPRAATNPSRICPTNVSVAAITPIPARPSANTPNAAKIQSTKKVHGFFLRAPIQMIIRPPRYTLGIAKTIAFIVKPRAFRISPV